MRIARYAVGRDMSFGLVQGPATGVGGDEPTDLSIAQLAGHPFAPAELTGTVHPLSAVRLLAPVLPSKVVCIGKNYADHVTEMGGAPEGQSAPADPVMFLKPSTSVIGPGDAITLPASSAHVDHEGELAVVIGRLCRNVPRERALEMVLGYTCANDVTARDQQKADGQWTRGKGHDTFCPLGPWVETELDPAALRVRCEVDEVLRQDGSTRDLLHDVPSLVAWVSAVMTLLPGDVLLTGTPAGVGRLLPGQTVQVEVEGVGALRNPVREL